MQQPGDGSFGSGGRGVKRSLGLGFKSGKFVFSTVFCR